MVFAKSMRILEAWSAMSSWQMWQSSGRAPSGGGDIVFRYAGEEFKVVLPRRQRNRRSVRSSAGCEPSNSGISTAPGATRQASAGAIASYQAGSDVAYVLRAGDGKLYRRRHKRIPIF
ncbi:MAG: hypothetical protein DMG69_25495 [Acidobacteria bacterium]|nr:MAG: hypothetical protein DMG69_25495 [Acidobacteriota bacterium]